jgi:hypothetical protein
MAFPDPLALKNVADATVSFPRMAPIPQGNSYRRDTSTAALTDEVTIRSLFTPKKGAAGAYNRNIVTFSRKILDTDDNVHTGSLSVSLVRPTAADFTDSDVEELFSLWEEFLVAASGSYKARYMRGET